MIQMQEDRMNSGQVELDVRGYSAGIVLQDTQAAGRGGIDLSKREGGIGQ